MFIPININEDSKLKHIDVGWKSYVVIAVIVCAVHALLQKKGLPGQMQKRKIKRMGMSKYSIDFSRQRVTRPLFIGVVSACHPLSQKFLLYEIQNRQRYQADIEDCLDDKFT